MQQFFLQLLQAFMLVLASSLDAFVASFAYGSGKIHIPLPSVLVINLICSGILLFSLTAGMALQAVLPSGFIIGACFAILCLLGLIKLFDSSIKACIRRHKNLHKRFRFSVSSLRFILHVYADPQEADRDASRQLSPGEAASLAVALSLDGIAVGFGAGLGDVNIWLAAALSLTLGTAMVLLGARLGNKLAHKRQMDVSWISGVLLILLAFMKLWM